MSFYKKTIADLPLESQVVLVRADYNVPLDEETGEIANDYRITQSLPTIKRLLEKHCTVVICSHLGRPKGKKVDSLTLEPVAKRLGELLGEKVKFLPVAVGDQVSQAVKKADKGSIILLENLRFHPEEEANDAGFAKELATSSRAHYFVQDGFGVVHRAHASTSAITQYLPSVAGLLIVKEYQHILGAMHNPKKPLLAVIGGAKTHDKLPLIKRFVDLADGLIIGGAVANSFLAFKGYKVGKSDVDKTLDDVIASIYELAKRKVGPDKANDFLLLPSDAAVALSKDHTAQRDEIQLDEVKPDEFILDMGPRSIEQTTQKIGQAKTVIWNGTLGLAETPQFAHGSARVALSLAENPGITSVIGGGDTAEFVLDWDGKNGRSFTHVSTGGGASLELMAGEKLPGVEALIDA